VDFEVEVNAVMPLPKDEARHIGKVLRGRDGDSLEIVDAARRLFAAELSDGGRSAVAIERLEAGEDRGEVTLCAAVPKGRHMDLVVEKATELGVGRVVPLITEYGVVRLDDGRSKLERWRRVAEAAARQSLRLFVPEVSEPVTFPEAAEEVGRSGVLLHNIGESPELEQVVEHPPVTVFVGPEGGWSEEEVEEAVGWGMSVARMGDFRLRSETAAIVAVARAMAVLDTLDRRGTTQVLGEEV
jgi:16S rRNA (uracil1498-N3)-methyltransferase